MRVFQELNNDFAKFAMFAAGKHTFKHSMEVPVLWVKKSQPGIGPTDIAGQNHFSKFLQRRPSRSSNSSESFGPHVPDA